jgi:hypothetical protein
MDSRGKRYKPNPETGCPDEIDSSGNIIKKDGTIRPAEIIYHCRRVPLEFRYHPEIPHQKRVNYVIAAWAGDRRENRKDLVVSAHYIKKQMDALARLKHSLKQITIVIPECSSSQGKSKEFENYINSLPLWWGGAKVKTLRRDNVGLCYGSWDAAYQKSREFFDYYIFMEDDYIPTQDYFDRILIQMFEASPNCGYLGTYIDKKPPRGPADKPYLMIPSGISSHAVLSKVCKQFERLPHARKVSKNVVYSSLPQLSFSNSFAAIGKWLYDFQTFYRAKLKDHLIGKDNLSFLIEPAC